MKAKTARTLLIAGTIIGGVMYFSQTARAQSTRLQTMTTENRMLYNTKEQLAQQVTGAEQEFVAQSRIEGDLVKAFSDLNVALNNYASVSDALINYDLADSTGAAKDYWTGVHNQLPTLKNNVKKLVHDNQRSLNYRNNNLLYL